MHNSPTSSLFTFLSDIDISEAKSTLTSRMESSLGVITQKFLKLLKESPQLELDLNYAATTLEIHKRRLYDITNVLEGIGFIKKKLKNNVLYIGNQGRNKCSDCGGTTFPGTKELSEIESLLRAEKDLNTELAQVNAELQQLACQEDNMSLAYVTYLDLKEISDFSAISLFAVKTPPGTLLDFPQSENKNENIVTFSSNYGKIDVFYLQDTLDMVK
ncbi:transcription factor E2F2 [Nematocida homosporus]|uniref:transcription factor E2F2 n=1 Tax=Nematocida homosporus TaxID=1912981 RepID=UPI00221E3A63|nr:transcription factor E2F2 [Nematocida homosporus]KAI5184950.1 transcription factor E2F2 [Nematocida homosporus]